MCPMRKPDQDQLSDDSVDAGTVGAGFGNHTAAEVAEGYGDADFTDDAEVAEADDTSFGGGSGDAHTNGDGVFTEDEAEDVLEDIFDDTYGDDAQEIVQEMEDDSGLSALELLEEITGLDLDGSDDESGYSNEAEPDIFHADADGALSPLDVNPFEPQELAEDMPNEGDFDLTGDGHVNHADLHEAAHVLDFHVGQ